MASGMVPETFPEPLPAYHAELDDEQRIEDQARARGGARFVARNRPEPHRAGDFHHRDAGFDHLEHASESCLDDLESRVLRRSEGRVGPALHGAATLCSAEHATEGGRLGPTLECDHEQRQRARPHAGGVGREPGLWGAIRPGRTSRAFAIIHIAIFDAVNAIAGGYQSYTGLPPAPLGTSKDAAIAQAAHDALVALFPSQTASFDLELAEDLSQIPNGAAKTQGIDLGHRAAAAILALRANDGSQHVEPSVGVDFITSDEVGKWRQDPISQIPLALGAYWGTVKPFVLWSADQFRVPPPPTLDSLAYTNAFYEVKLLGGDGVVTPTVRTEDQT